MVRALVLVSLKDGAGQKFGGSLQWLGGRMIIEFVILLLVLSCVSPIYPLEASW